MRCRVRAVVATSLFFACPIESPAQGGVSSAEVTALTREVQATRQSVDDLLAVFKRYLVESAHRERVTLLLRRIEVAEQQAGNIAAELRTLRAQLADRERGVQQSRGRLNSARSMQAFNPDANAAEALLQEQKSALAEEEIAVSSIEKIQPRVAELESELAARKASIRALEAQLDKELSAGPR